MKCPQCKIEGKVSTIHEDGPSMATCVYYPPGYYDENGNYVSNPDRNTTSQQHLCYNGHKLRISSCMGETQILLIKEKA